MAATATLTSAGPQYAPEDPTLPRPWKGLVDGKTGYLYYWNPETNVTQYEKPTGGASQKPLVPLSSSIQVQPSSEAQRRGYSPERDDRHRRANNGGYDHGSRDHQNDRGGTSNYQNGVRGIVSSGPVAPSAGSNLSADAYSRKHEITVIGDRVPPPLTSFEATGFPSEILREMRYLLLEELMSYAVLPTSGGLRIFGVPLNGGPIP